MARCTRRGKSWCVFMAKTVQIHAADRVEVGLWPTALLHVSESDDKDDKQHVENVEYTPSSISNAAITLVQRSECVQRCLTE